MITFRHSVFFKTCINLALTKCPLNITHFCFLYLSSGVNVFYLFCKCES